MEEKKGNVCPMCVALVPDGSSRAMARQVLLSTGRKLSVIIPEGMSGQETLEALAFLNTVEDELYEAADMSTGVVDPEPDEIALPMRCSGRMALLMVPPSMSEQELMELKEDMVSLTQPNVLEDAIVESRAVESKSILDLNLPLGSHQQLQELRVGKLSFLQPFCSSENWRGPRPSGRGGASVKDCP